MNNIEHKESSPKNYTLGVVGLLLLMLGFAAVVWIPYFSSRTSSATVEIVAERKAKLADVKAKQQELISSYAWVDKEAKIVRIPIDRAMKLTVKALNEKPALVPEPRQEKK